MERRSVNQLVALIFGAVYLIVGIAGFFVTKFDDFASGMNLTNNEFLGFALNPLHNIVHIVIGVFLVAGSRAHRSARMANLVVGVALVAVFVYGLFVVGKQTSGNFLALNSADNILHIVTAVILLAVAVLADRSMRMASDARAAGAGM